MKLNIGRMNEFALKYTLRGGKLLTFKTLGPVDLSGLNFIQFKTDLIAM